MKKLITTLSFAAAIICSSTMAHAENYRVCRGDTLSEIGERFGVCYRQIMRSNSLTCLTIHPGQVLHIPNGRSIAPVSVYSSKKKPSQRARIHTVRRGESLGVICNRYDVAVDEVLRVNGLRSTTIYVGQNLKIPSAHRYNFASY